MRRLLTGRPPRGRAIERAAVRASRIWRSALSRWSEATNRRGSMALASMTGFARTAFEADGAKYSWELKSVNARGLEVRLRLPAGLDHLEAEVRTQVRERIARGSCFLTLARETESEQRRVVLNESALALVVAAARRLAAVDGIGAPTADGLLAIPGRARGRRAWRSRAKSPSAATRPRWRRFRPRSTSSIAARVEEGRRLAAVLADQLKSVEDLVAAGEADRGGGAGAAEGAHPRSGGAPDRRWRRSQPRAAAPGSADRRDARRRARGDRPADQPHRERARPGRSRAARSGGGSTSSRRSSTARPTRSAPRPLTIG